MTGPLAGVTVVELGRAVSGPYGTTLLGDLGADVIKVEQPGGGPQRTINTNADTHGHDALTWRFLTLNRSKQSIVIDLKTAEGQDVFARLLESADVFLENIRSKALTQLGFEWEEIHETLPELIYCSINGYGETGPYSEWPSLDTTVQGASGLASQVGDSDGPGSMNVYIIDMLTGIYAALSILAALYERRESGQGQRVNVSMLDSAISLLGWQLADYSAARQDPDIDPTYGPSFAPNGHFETADGYISIFAPPQRWPALCEAIECPSWTDEAHQFGTPGGRLEHRTELREAIEDILTEQTTSEWLERLTAGETIVPAAPANGIEEVVDDPQVQASESVIERTHEVMGDHLLPNIVPSYSRTPGSISDAPTLGGNTDEILTSIGFSEAELDDLRANNIVD